jgi:hypothetical protein
MLLEEEEDEKSLMMFICFGAENGVTLLALRVGRTPGLARIFWTME